jgi:tetratricopeptide (TPR) repeat protein
MRRGLLCILVAGTCLGQASIPGDPLDHAWQLVRQGHPEEAISLLRQIVAKDGGNGEARLLLGSLLTERRQPEAVDQLKAAVRMMPQSAEAENALGEAYLALGDRSAARTPLEKAVALQPGFGVAQLNLGRLLLQSGELGAAAQHLEVATRGLKEKDDAAEAQYLLGKDLGMRDDPQNAAAHLRKAVELNPGFAEAWSELGAEQQLLQNETAALQAYERATSLKPSDAIAQYRLGSELLQLGKAGEAVKHLQAAYEANPGDQSTLNALQIALRRDDRAAEADEVRRKLADMLRSRDEQNQNALEAVKLNNEGAALEKSGDLRNAAEKYSAALQLDPQHNGIRVNYGVALLRLGEWTKGLNELHEAAERDPGNRLIQAALKDALSQAPPGTVPAWNDAKASK